MLVVDASALVAIMCSEPEADSLIAVMEHAIQDEEGIVASEISVWEAACAISRIRRESRPQALLKVEEFLRLAAISRAPVNEDITRIAVDAGERYGAGNINGNPAILNLGDCFSYATARYFSARLLSKGDDFPKTDIELA